MKVTYELESDYTITLWTPHERKLHYLVIVKNEYGQELERLKTASTAEKNKCLNSS